MISRTCTARARAAPLDLFVPGNYVPGWISGRAEGLEYREVNHDMIFEGFPETAPTSPVVSGGLQPQSSVAGAWPAGLPAYVPRRFCFLRIKQLTALNSRRKRTVLRDGISDRTEAECGGLGSVSLSVTWSLPPAGCYFGLCGWVGVGVHVVGGEMCLSRRVPKARVLARGTFNLSNLTSRAGGRCSVAVRYDKGSACKQRQQKISNCPE